MPSEELKSVKAIVKKEDNNDDDDDDKPLALAKRTYNIKKEPKVVKKEQNEFDYDDDDHKPISLTKKKTPITKAMKESTKLKKELSDEDDHKPLAKTRKTSTTKVKKEVKKKKIKKEIKKVSGSGNTEQQKKEKKVYDLPGQKRDQPDEKDPLRIFYESLNKLMESGLLPKDEAMEVYEKKQKKSMQQRVTSPVKAATVVKRRSTKSVTVKRKTKTSVKKKTTNSTSKLSKKRKSDCMSSEDEGDSDYGNGSKTAKRRKAA